MLRQFLKRRAIQVEPRDYQRRIVEQALKAFTAKEGERLHSVLIESPTGSGKTVMGLLIAAWLQEREGISVGWVAMRRNLLAQAQAENLARNFEVDLKLISMFDKHPPQVDLLVVDEAQHDAAASMASLHATSRPTRILGLTATPFRTDRLRLCFERVIRDAGIHRLIQDGYLSHYHHYTIPDFAPEGVAATYAEQREQWGKSLIFFHRLEECRRCLAELRQRGIRSDVVTGSSNREQQLDAFARGELDVLVNMAVLTEGFDQPDLKTVFCRPSGKGCTIQMAGRVLRKHPDHPFKQIVQCRNTRHPFPKTATAAEQYVWSETGWQSLKPNQRIDEISRNALLLISRTETQLPRCLQNRAPRSLYDLAPDVGPVEPIEW